MSPIDQTASSKLIEFDQTLETPLTLEVHTTGQDHDQPFLNLIKEINQVTTRLKLKQIDENKNTPGLIIEQNILYSALPFERELPPFINALAQLSQNKPTVSTSIKEALDKIDIPVSLKLYIAQQCPHCPAVVETVIPLALYSDKINLHIIDGTLFPDMAQTDQVMSAPCLILEDNFRWTGAVTAQEILSMITDQDPSQLSTDTLKNILEQGDAQWISTQMIKADKLFNGFIGLLLHETWSVRLGAMVIIETLSEESPSLCAALCPLLIEKFENQDIPVQGDILYALGEAGDTSTLKWIQTQKDNFTHPDLKDAAIEAIEMLEEK